MYLFNSVGEHINGVTSFASDVRSGNMPVAQLHRYITLISSKQTISNLKISFNVWTNTHMVTFEYPQRNKFVENLVKRLRKTKCDVRQGPRPEGSEGWCCCVVEHDDKDYLLRTFRSHTMLPPFLQAPWKLGIVLAMW